MKQAFLNHLNEIIHDTIESTASILGGDIHEARKLKGKNQHYFLKLNKLPNTLRMFHAEKDGLQVLKMLGSVETPEVIAIGQWESMSYLVLSFVDEGYMDDHFWISFARDLARLHQCSRESFGYEKSNFIGWLVQSNASHPAWDKFYVEERILPQMRMGVDKGLLYKEDINDINTLCLKIGEICPNEPPSLIHGDLWQGNFLASQSGSVILIDPAISYSHREMDLAMAKLFGGFSNEFFSAYHEAYPLEPGFEDRIAVYQLYYLMVHLNLFGKSYAPAVRKIISDFVD